MLLTEGEENADIAKRVHISLSTPEGHVSAILEKLGVENRVQAAVYAIRHGLVEAAED